MPSHTSPDVVDFSDRPQSVANKLDSYYGGMVSGINKEIDQTVADRIKHGDYVPPPNYFSLGSAGHRAVEKAMGDPFAFIDGGIAMHGRGFDDYAARTREATRGIDSQERQIAQQRWDALSPGERRTIEHEQAERKRWDSMLLFSNNNPPPTTPHLDAFIKGVDQAIAPLERQREAAYHKVWQELPVQSKTAIFRSMEESKHFRPM